MRSNPKGPAPKGLRGPFSGRASVLLASIVSLILAAPAIAQRGGGGSHGSGGGHGSSGGGMRGGSGGGSGGSRGGPSGGMRGGSGGVSGGSRGSAPGYRGPGGGSGGSRGSAPGYRGPGGGTRGTAPGARSGYRPGWGNASRNNSGYYRGGRPPGSGGYRPGYGHGGYGHYGRPYNYYRGAYWGGYGWYPWYASTWWWWGTPYWGWGWNWWPQQSYVVNEEVAYGRARFAAVETDVSPEESEVWLDGQYVGSADDFDGYPDYLYLKPGKYRLEFKVVGYEPVGVDLEVTRGELSKIDQNLKRLPGTSKFQEFPKSRGMPYGRYFGAGGKPAGDERAPRVGEKYDVVPYGAGAAAAADDDFELPPPKADRMPPSAAPPTKPGRARVRFSVLPEDAAIYVDDRYVGAGEDLNNSPRGLITDPGAHTIVVTRPGFKTKTVTVDAKAGQPVDVVVDLEKQ